MNLLQALELVKEPNYTTIEQSKHLLDLGLPSDSADLYFGKDKKKFTILMEVYLAQCYGLLRVFLAGRLNG